MRKTRNNKKGFTLVELIVVMAIMSIVMTAVMMIIKPTNNVYRKVNNTKNQESVCLQVGNAISGEIKYSKRVSVYRCSASDPFPAVDATTFPKVIRIDNTAVRPDSKKNATGVFQKGMNTGSGMANSSYLVTKDIYDEDSYRIILNEYCNNGSVSGGSSSSSSSSSTAAVDSAYYITLGMTANTLVYNGSSYEEDSASTYNYSKTIEFTNITYKGLIGATGSLNVIPPTGGSDDVIYIFYSDPDTP